jgi:ADP-heptose:LPS heptosyltransferase
LKKQSDKWYDKLIKIDEDIKFEVNKNFAFVKQLTNHTIEASFINISNLMNNVVGVNRTRAYIVINLGASNICRVWAMEDFAQLINCLDGNVDVVLLGSASEQNLFQQLRPYLTRKINNLIGKTSLLDTINIVASAQLFIGNETSTSHIAAAVNTPSVCILGGGHFARFMPYDLKQEWNWPHAVYHKMDCFNCNWQCVYPLENNQTWRCIARVPVEPVINLVKELLCKKN